MFMLWVLSKDQRIRSYSFVHSTRAEFVPRKKKKWFWAGPGTFCFWHPFCSVYTPWPIYLNIYHFDIFIFYSDFIIFCLNMKNAKNNFLYCFIFICTVWVGDLDVGISETLPVDSLPVRRFWNWGRGLVGCLPWCR